MKNTGSTVCLFLNKIAFFFCFFFRYDLKQFYNMFRRMTQILELGHSAIHIRITWRLNLGSIFVQDITRHKRVHYFWVQLLRCKPSHCDPFWCRPVLLLVHFDANRLKALLFRCNLFSFNTIMRGIHVCVFIDKVRFYDLICVSNTLCIDSLESCSQIYKCKFHKFNYKDLLTIG